VCTLREGEFGQQFGNVGADEVAGKQLGVLAVGDQLDEAAGVAQPVRLGVGGERELDCLFGRRLPGTRARLLDRRGSHGAKVAWKCATRKCRR
jgi:hypothetical protein